MRCIGSTQKVSPSRVCDFDGKKSLQNDTVLNNPSTVCDTKIGWF